MYNFGNFNLKIIYCTSSISVLRAVSKRHEHWSISSIKLLSIKVPNGRMFTSKTTWNQFRSWYYIEKELVEWTFFFEQQIIYIWKMYVRMWNERRKKKKKPMSKHYSFHSVLLHTRFCHEKCKKYRIFCFRALDQSVAPFNHKLNQNAI